MNTQSFSSTINMSPPMVKTIASPRMLRGLTLFKCTSDWSPIGMMNQKHISSSTNDEIEEEEAFEGFEQPDGAGRFNNRRQSIGVEQDIHEQPSQT